MISEASHFIIASVILRCGSLSDTRHYDTLRHMTLYSICPRCFLTGCLKELILPKLNISQRLSNKRYTYNLILYY